MAGKLEKGLATLHDAPKANEERIEELEYQVCFRCKGYCSFGDAHEGSSLK